MSILQSKGKTPVETQPPTVEIEIPNQADFYKLPARFGALPLDEAPLGYEIETKRRETKVTKFEHAWPNRTARIQSRVCPERRGDWPLQR